MNISIIGSRGIPAKYGGYEIFAEKLSTRLVKKGFSVTVSCEYNEEQMANYDGVNLKYFPYVPPKNYTLRKFYEIFNDTYFMMKMSRSSDVIYVLGTTAGGMMFLPKLFNRKVHAIVNIGGLEWKRDKWSRLEKFLLKLNTILAILFSDTVVVDSQAMKKYVGTIGECKTVFISYGSDIPNAVDWNVNRLTALSQKCKKIANIERNNYWLEIARLEPDNNIHIVIEGYLKSRSCKPLVIIGDYTSDEYKEMVENILKRDTEGRVLMVGSIYNSRELLDMFRQNCFGYIHAHSFGGTNPSLLEAMASKIIIVSHDNEFNKEVCGDSALYFRDSEDLGRTIKSIDDNQNFYNSIKEQAYGKVKDNYSWESIVEEYQKLFNNIF